MNWIKWVIVSLAIIVVAGGGGYALYFVAYDMGDAAGYGRGYSTGQQAGYSSGQQAGYDSGYASGRIEGYDQGLAEGYEEGYDEGMEAGFGHGYALTDPTYEEAVDFIKEDKTSDNEYDDADYGVYVCSHFSRDVCNNAEAEGMRCAFVLLIYPEGGHAVVAFDTTDEGLVYFDAITDEKTNPIIGKRYYQCIETKPGYYYLPPEHDDTIMDVLVIW